MHAIDASCCLMAFGGTTTYEHLNIFTISQHLGPYIFWVDNISNTKFLFLWNFVVVENYIFFKVIFLEKKCPLLEAGPSGAAIKLAVTWEIIM